MPDAAPSSKLLSFPEESLPREKLMARGRAALTDEELIAIFLRTGLPGCNVLELAARLKHKAGSLSALGSMEAAEIASLLDKGIGPAKAATLAAVFELGQRAVRESYERCHMADARAVYDYLAGELRYETQENLVELLLDAKRRLIRRVYIAKGTLTRVTTHPRDIYREAIRHNAASVVIVHNHPSGDPTPSSQDKTLTAALVEAGAVLGVKFVDHVIIGSPAPGRKPYFSFLENGLIAKGAASSTDS